MKAKDLKRYGIFSIIGDPERELGQPYPILDLQNPKDFTFAKMENRGFVEFVNQGTVVTPEMPKVIRTNVTYVHAEDPKMVFLRALTEMVNRGVVQKGSIVISGDTIIHPTAVIGSDGFGFVRDGNGVFQRMPQIGGVVIRSGVEIGAHAVVSRGTLGDTVLCKGVKVSHGTVIGHNVFIAEDSFVAGNCALGGGVTIGERCQLGSGVIVNPQIKIWSGVVVGGGAVVTKNFIGEGQVLAGNPARVIKRVKRGEPLSGLPPQ